MTKRRHLLLAASAFTLPWSVLAGAWAETSFANDGALDWVIDFKREGSVSFVRQTLERILSGGYVDSFDAQAAIAASEVVALALGKPSADFPKELVERCMSMREELALLSGTAKLAVNRPGGATSEVTESWGANAESLSRWQAAVQDLLRRLSGNAA